MFNQGNKKTAPGFNLHCSQLQLHPGSPTIHSKDHGVQHRAAHVLSQEFCELCHSGIIRTQLI